MEQGIHFKLAKFTELAKECAEKVSKIRHKDLERWKESIQMNAKRIVISGIILSLAAVIIAEVRRRKQLAEIEAEILEDMNES